jgi:hypothetical protein
MIRRDHDPILSFDVLPVEELESLQAYLTDEEKQQLDRLLCDPQAARRRYRDDPIAFATDVLGVERLHPYQKDILNSIATKRRVCVRSLHGIGKTACAAMVILWYVTTRDECKVATTASAWRQLNEFLWPEIHKWAIRADWSKIGLTIRRDRELLKHKLELSALAFAFAMASDREDSLEGAHSANMLFVFDEAKSIPTGVWDAAEGALSTEGAKAIAFSTPGESAGRFYDIQMRKPGFEDWHTIHISLPEGIASGQVTEEWAEQRKKAWGEHSPLYQRRVLGNFAEDDSETVIRLTHIERANQRWEQKWQQVEMLIEGGMKRHEAITLVYGSFDILAVDPARLGSDKTAYAFRYGMSIYKLERTVKQDLMQTAGRIVSLTRHTTATVRIEMNGLGAGAYDRVREVWKEGQWRPDATVCPVEPINVSTKVDATDRSGELKFNSLRDYAWWHMRELLEDENSEIALPPDDDLTTDLVTPKYSFTSSGKLVIEKKDDIRSRLPQKRSPDSGDAVVQAFLPETPPYKPLFDFL